ncbi:CD166 antigen-like [Mastacembelus armatus]|uniref:CD166 antigen-like n=1 Tax=Mastacembelus armatus TaxID=205130 RepID=UPI000E463538|nr:CD166 antigen-like [Mastacembelus armatus]
MKTFLGLLMVLIVSGDDVVTIKGMLEDNVVLPCRCTNIDSNSMSKWQMEEPVKAPVNNSSGTYKDRAKIFSNCSLLLTNITANDQGKYRCSFFRQGTYTYLFVNLTVFAKYSVCQPSTANSLNGLQTFQCDVEGNYKEAEIQWHMDGHLLTNSSTINITPTYTLKTHTGLYNFSSKLITELNWTSHPTCHLKPKVIQPNITRSNCSTVSNFSEMRRLQNRERKYRYIKVIPIVLVLGLSLFLFRCWKFSKAY